MYVSQVWSILLFVIYLCCACALLIIALLIFESKLHGIFGLAAALTVGIGIFIYRLCRGQRTRVIKYVHLGIQFVALIFIIVSLVFALLEKGDEPYVGTHTYPCYVIFAAIILQFAVAIFVFTYLYENPRLRLYLAPFHDIFGLWIFLCLAGLCLTGPMLVKESDYSDGSPPATTAAPPAAPAPAPDGANAELIFGPELEPQALICNTEQYRPLPTADKFGNVLYNNIALVCFLLTVFVVLCPAFEWELVGPI